MEDGQYLHAIRQDDIIDDMPKSRQPRGPNVAPHYSKKLGKRMNLIQSFSNGGDESFSEPATNQLVVFALSADVRFREPTNDDRQTHKSASIESNASA